VCRTSSAVAERGYSFIELIIVTAVLLVLASAILPMAQVTAQRQREVELRRSLREMRTAIDRFKDSVDQGIIPTTELEPQNEGYPPDLDTLVNGVSVANDASGRKLKFLRRIPVDPITGRSGASAPTRIGPTRSDGAGRTCSTSTR
jgi:general secretion pathway protein G